MIHAISHISSSDTLIVGLYVISVPDIVLAIIFCRLASSAAAAALSASASASSLASSASLATSSSASIASISAIVYPARRLSVPICSAIASASSPKHKHCVCT